MTAKSVSHGKRTTACVSKAALGAPEAITATAHKLARIYYAMLKTRTPYDESKIAGNPEKVAQRKRQRLENQAAKLGFALTPLPALTM